MRLRLRLRLYSVVVAAIVVLSALAGCSCCSMAAPSGRETWHRKLSIFALLPCPMVMP